MPTSEENPFEGLLATAAEAGPFDPHVPPEVSEGDVEDPGRREQRLDARCSREFTAWRNSGKRAASAIRLVVVHCTESNTARSSAGWFTNLGAKGSAHLVVDGKECYRTLGDEMIPHAAPGANTAGLHLEITGWARWTRAEWMRHEASIRRGVHHAAAWAKKYGIPVKLLTRAELGAGARGFTTHADCTAVFGGDHTDPGRGFPISEFIAWTRDAAGPGNEPERPDHDADWPWFAEWSLWVLGRGEYLPYGRQNPEVRPLEAPTRIPANAWTILDLLRGTAEPEVTTRSELLKAPRAKREQLEAYVVKRPHAPHSDAIARKVAGLYYTIATPVGLDPLLGVTQMILETANLQSKWAISHYNLAGIGVTNPDIDPAEVPNFDSWEGGVRGHVGRMLAYAIPYGHENDAQHQLIDFALSKRPLWNKLRGQAPRLGDLAGKWAEDPAYGGNLARLANEIRRSRPA